MTPGIKNKRVNIKLIKKSFPIPLESATPTGGIKMFKMMVRILMVNVFDLSKFIRYLKKFS
mgnify:CR=1 FL=1|tara:strand:+ start:3138 stop:3320 length:183 start_codon:yes stop_codon:yes gene_type:complete